MSHALSYEFERKFDITGQHGFLDGFADLPTQDIEQYYVNHINEPYELRFRQNKTGATTTHTATIKSTTLPNRIEIETPITADTYEQFAEYEQGRIAKSRIVIPRAIGHWAIDRFTSHDLVMLEAEMEGADLPAVGHEVTEDPYYKNSFLARVDASKLTTLYKKDRSDLLRITQSIVSAQVAGGLSIIGVAGRTASGKTTIAKQLSDRPGATLLSMDNYYKGRMRMDCEFPYEAPQHNFDAPGAIDIERLAEDLADLRDGKTVRTPNYDMSTGERSGEATVIDPTTIDCLVVEGLFTLLPPLRLLVDEALYVDAPIATRLGRRLTRDVVEGRAFAPAENLRYCLEIAEPTYQRYATVQKKLANGVVTT